MLDGELHQSFDRVVLETEGVEEEEVHLREAIPSLRIRTTRQLERDKQHSELAVTKVVGSSEEATSPQVHWSALSRAKVAVILILVDPIARRRVLMILGLDLLHLLT